MVSLVALIIWRINALVVLFVFLVYILLDAAFLSSALHKVPQGAWFTLVLSFVLSLIFILWRWGKEQQWTAEAADRISSSDLLAGPTEGSQATDDGQQAPQLTLAPEYGGGSITPAPGIGIFFDKVGGTGDAIPKVLTQFVRKFKTRPRVIVFFHMRPLSQPTVSPDQRFVVTRVTSRLPSCYRMTLRHGYLDDVLTPDLARIIVLELMLYITRGALDLSEGERPPHIREEMATLRSAQEEQMVYLIGKQTMRILHSRGTIFRRLALGAFLWIRENSRTKLEDLDIDPDNLVEVGFVKGI